MVNNKFRTPHILRPVHDSSINQKTLVLQRVLIVDVDISKLLRDCNVENFTSSNKQAAQACTLSTLSREEPPLCPLLEILSGLSGQAQPRPTPRILPWKVQSSQRAPRIGPHLIAQNLLLPLRNHLSPLALRKS